MNSLRLDNLRSILCLGAHPDDIEIGCGGTLLKLLKENNAEVHWIVFSGNEIRKAEALKSAEHWLANSDRPKIEIFDFEDARFPNQWNEIKNAMCQIGESVSPDLIFTHYQNDRHQDHRIISELTWQTFRNHAILEYEIPKFEGDLCQPNCYVEIESNDLNRKIDGLLKFHKSQMSKPWFDKELLQGLMRLRGVECTAQYAEAFHAHKLSLTF